MATVYVVKYKDNHDPLYQTVVTCSLLSDACAAVMHLLGRALGRPKRDYMSKDYWSMMLTRQDFTTLVETNIFEVEPDQVDDEYVERLLENVNEVLHKNSSSPDIIVRTESETPS